METTNHPAETCSGNSLDGASPSDYDVNDATCENLNVFMDSLVFSDEKDSKEYRDNISNNHSDDATTTVSKYSYDANNNNNTNEQQSKSTLRSIDLLENMELKFEEGCDTDGKLGPFYDATPALEESSVEDDEHTLCY